MEKEYCVSLRLINVHDTSVDLILEPWGEIYKVEPHVAWIVTFKSCIPPFGSRSHAIEIEYGQEHITVYGWEQSTAILFREDEEMPQAFDSERASAPKIPGE